MRWVEFLPDHVPYTKAALLSETHLIWMGNCHVMSIPNEPTQTAVHSITGSLSSLCFSVSLDKIYSSWCGLLANIHRNNHISQCDFGIGGHWPTNIPMGIPASITRIHSTQIPNNIMNNYRANRFLISLNSNDVDAQLALMGNRKWIYDRLIDHRLTAIVSYFHKEIWPENARFNI